MNKAGRLRLQRMQQSVKMAFARPCYIIPLSETKENIMYEVNRSVFLLIPLDPFELAANPAR